LNHNEVKRILVVGFGSIGQRHNEVVREIYPDIKVALLRHKQCTENALFHVDECFTELDEAIAFEPDMAIVATPASTHVDVAMALAQAGIHLLIEKPIASHATGIEALLDQCSKNNIKLMVAYNLRFLPSLIYFKKQLASNELLGDLLSVRAEVGQYLPDWRPNSDYRKTVSARQELGGGVLLELSHEIDYLLWLFGDAVWVKATVSRQSNLDVNVEDTAHLHIGFSKNDTDRELIVRLDMDFIRHDTTRQCVAIGEKGSLCWDAIAGTVAFFPKGGDQWTLLFSDKPERNYTYKEELKSFVSCIESNLSPVVSGDDGLSVVSLIDAAKRSHHESKSIMLD
jgi:predicted dehydrogenase